MSSDSIGFAAAELREHIEQDGLSGDDLSALSACGLVDEDVADRLLAYRRAYNRQPSEERDPYWACETERWERLVERHVAKAINKAVRNDRQSAINYALGKIQDNSTHTDFVQMKKLEKWVKKDGRLVVWGGQMGNGKTNGAIKLCEFYSAIYPDVSIASNIPSFKRAEFVGGVEDLEEWIEETEGKKTVVLDEMSSQATGYAHDSSTVVQQLAGMVRTMRHEGVDLMQIIGHRVQADIHPSIRELADIALKEEIDTLRVYDSMTGDSASDLKFEVPINETSWLYDSEESETPWEWLSDEEFDWEQYAKYTAVEVWRESDLSQREVAALFDGDEVSISASTISRTAKGAGA